jgi:eukaryotic-like serine/threonine-protein kinase
MRKFGLLAAIVGFCILASDLLLRLLSHANSWLWLPGFLLLAVGSVALFRSRLPASVTAPAAKLPAVPGTDTARMLDNFEQRFAELKGRKPNATVLADLYTLGTQLETRGRVTQATAVYRHLARFDNTYRDVGTRLKRLMDAERTRLKSLATVAQPSKAPNNAAAPAGKTAVSADAPARQNFEDVPADQRLGRYLLEREIGRGAMGIVYLGRDSAINRLVAIKAIPLTAEFSDAELAEARMRFFREAETAGRLNHPNIVTIYDVGEERGLAYIAMEYLTGRHLSDYAASNNLLEPRKVMELIARTAEALGFAHKQQVVHRDIKPANLMYDPSTQVLKITDFGIARLTGAGSTRTGIVLGTPSFMSPEQLEGRTVTGRSDLFSLGVSLFQLLTGQLPFTADSMTGLMQQIAEAPHPPLRAFRPDLPACVQTIIDRALAKDPEARFDSGAQMAAALDDCRSRMPSGQP